MFEDSFPGVALITGAASGIGRATALAFAAAGCQSLALCDLNSSGLKETSDTIRSQFPACETYTAAISTADESAVADFVAHTVKVFGGVHYAVNSAGVIGNNERTTETSIEEFERINSVNYRGAWLVGREVLRVMVKQDLTERRGRGERGCVVHVASQLGIVSRPNAPAYCASKAAVISLTKSDAIDYSKDKIRVNCVCPGVIATPMTVGNPEFMKKLEPAINIAPMERMGTAEEVADAVLFLCSERASFVQGAALVVDGGYTIN